MTDNEIIKVLECCANNSEEKCRECPFHKLKTCIDELERNAFDLINRQKEDIDELEAIVDLRSKRKYYQKFVTEVYQKEKGNELSAPDFDYIYELYFKQREEIERLKKTIKSHEKIRRAYQRYLIGNGVEYLWDATIKEFAERAKGKAHFSEDFGEAAVSCHDIDALVKEMTEEKK